MTQYLLTCQCGQNVAVEIGQAGERVSCQCGTMLDVPPLRKLRHLPVVPVATASVVPRVHSWNVRRGIIAALLILATSLAFWALWSRLTEPRVAPFDADVRQRLVDEDVERMTPVQAWQIWIERYRPLAERGFSELQHPHAAAIEQLVAKRRFLQKTLLATAGVFAGIALITALWPQEKTRRQGDKETRRRN
jgi:hypothetical protein